MDICQSSFSPLKFNETFKDRKPAQKELQNRIYASRIYGKKFLEMNSRRVLEKCYWESVCNNCKYVH